MRSATCFFHGHVDHRPTQRRNWLSTYGEVGTSYNGVGFPNVFRRSPLTLFSGER